MAKRDRTPTRLLNPFHPMPNAAAILPTYARSGTDCPATSRIAAADVANQHRRTRTPARSPTLSAMLPNPAANAPAAPPRSCYRHSRSRPHWREELVRVDHNISPTSCALTFRYIHDSWATVVANPLWGVELPASQHQYQLRGPGHQRCGAPHRECNAYPIKRIRRSATPPTTSFLTALTLPAVPPA